jgi:hypothetical protein
VSAAGTTVRSFASAAAGDPVDVSWDLKNATGTPVPPGSYTLRLTGAAADGTTTLPWTAPVSVRFPSIPKGSWMRTSELTAGG